MTNNPLPDLRKNYLSNRMIVDYGILSAALVEWKGMHTDDLYNINTARERMSPALAKTRSYYLRVPVISKDAVKTTQDTQDILECRDTELLGRFPNIRQLIDEIGYTHYGKWTHVGRIFVTRLDPSSSIGRHVDEGKYFRCLHRHHVVLASSGSRFHWDIGSTVLNEGEIHVVNNSIPHWVENSNTLRTHLIFDAV